MQLLYFILTGLGGLLILLVGEFGWDRGWWRGEWARKFVHSAIGVFVATWPFYLDYDLIRLISILLVIGFVVSMRFKLFHSIGGIARISYGEVLFALMIGFLTLIAGTKGIYATAMLHLALADSAAAVFGVRWGKSTAYKVLGHTKSLVGSATFFAVSFMLCAVFCHHSPWYAASPWARRSEPRRNFLENVGIYGLDNLYVPLYVASVLSLLI
jgi:dolichol kinase